jgi:hypothetical protein
MFVCINLDGSQESVDKMNWHLSNGYKVVDRFEASTFVTVMFEKV